MTEFSDLKKLRAVLDALDPPMVMIGRCQTCAHWERISGPNGLTEYGACLSRDVALKVEIAGLTPISYGCICWQVRP